MKKWEEQNQKKHHQKKLQEVKSAIGIKTVNRSSSDLKSPTPIPKSQGSSTYGTLYSPQKSSNETPRSSNTSQISDYYSFEKQDLAQIPLFKLLKHYSLQQYAKALISRGFGYDLTRLSALSRDELDKLSSEIKMMPGHKVKLMKMVSQVSKICYEILEQDDLKQYKQNVYTRATSADLNRSKPSITTRSQSGPKSDPKKPADKRTNTSINERKPTTGSRPNLPTGAKKVTKPASVAVPKSQASKNENKLTKTKKLEKIGFDFFSDSQMDDEFSRVLDNILDKYQSEVEQNSFQPLPFLSNSRKEKPDNELLRKVHYSEESNLKSNLKSVLDDIDTRELSDIIHRGAADDSTIPLTNDKSDTYHSSPAKYTETSSKTGQKEELSLPSEREIKQKDEQRKAGQEARAKILDMLENKLDSNNLNPDNLNVEFKKIKDMYSSFDGAKMTSTIANLDIEEMCYCLACAIQKHVEFFVQTIYPNGIFLPPPPVAIKETVKKPEKTVAVEAEVKKEHEEDIAKLRYNVQDQPLVNANDQVRVDRSLEREKDDSEIETSYEKEAQRFSIQGTESNAGIEDMEEVVEDDFDEDNYVEELLGNDHHIGDDMVYHREEDDDVVQMESGGIGNEDEEEEKIDYNYDLEPFAAAKISAYDPTGPFMKKSLDIISEKTFETSQNTVGLLQQSVKSNMEELQEDNTHEEGNKEEIEGFLRESLRDSLMLNLKQEKQIEAQSKKTEGTASGFSMQVFPTHAADYPAGSIDLVSQVMGDNKTTLGSQQQYVDRGVAPPQKDKDMSDFSMEESLFTELELDYQNMDVAQRIKAVFERTYNEKNLNGEQYIKKVQDTVDKGSVSNYCKNVVITTKMEKEVIIICLIYIERLIVRTNMYLNAINWKRITFAALILASKVWDDESFENNNFAKAFPQFTTKEINDLERVFLEFLDYDLKIGGTDYAKYYFILRTFAEKNKKSFPLKAINLQTVRLLQKNAANTSKTLKEMYADPLNKTFS